MREKGKEKKQKKQNLEEKKQELNLKAEHAKLELDLKAAQAKQSLNAGAENLKVGKEAKRPLQGDPFYCKDRTPAADRDRCTIIVPVFLQADWLKGFMTSESIVVPESIQKLE